MSGKQTTLDLNGPILSFIQQPQSVTLSCEDILSGARASFTSSAIATFPEQTPENPATNTGTIAYRWYDENGPLFDNPPPEGGDGLTIVGANTTTLTLFDNRSERRLFLRATYIPSAYSQPPGSAVDVGTARSTGRAISDFVDSNIVELNLGPTIILTSEPLDQTSAETRDANFSVTAITTDESQLSYQWQLNDVNLNDGTFETASSLPFTATLTITDNLGGSTVVNFNRISSYSNFITGRTYTLVANSNLQTKITALGAGGGASIERSVAGGVGGNSSGTFTFLANQQYRLIVGGRGVNGGSGGFGGGGSGGEGRGRGGGGGGYTGLFINSVTQSNAVIIAAGGGGGANDPARGGAGGGLNGGNSTNASITQTNSILLRGGTGATQTSGGSGFRSGTALQGGAGSGGGGGGYFGGGSGRPFSGCCEDGAGGGGSGFLHPTLLTSASTTAGGGSTGDGSFKIDLLSATKIVNVTASGTKTPNLTIRTNSFGLNQVKCIITHPTACNSPVITRVANFNVVEARDLFNFELVDDNGNFFGLGSQVIDSTNSLRFDADPNNPNRSISLYCLEKDIRARVTLAGGAGASRNEFVGGQGGESIFEYTFKRNIEYVIKIGSQSNLTGGSNGGGAGAFLYEKARIIAVCGGGGGAGTLGRGGSGGGIGVSGENGQGQNSGTGGIRINNGQLSTSSGTSPSGTTGGRVAGCTIGSYWRSQGFSSCQDVGLVKWRGVNGEIVNETTDIITRGYKSGFGFRDNGGDGIGNQGGGGSGATGGNAATGNNSGGGGGSGYTDGSVNVINTQLGGNSSTNAFVVIELVL
jgi:hypothetical protein